MARCFRVAIGAIAFLAACGVERSPAPPRAAVVPIVVTTDAGASTVEESAPVVEATPEPARPPLERAALTRFASRAKVCAALREQAESERLKDLTPPPFGGIPFSTVRTDCRARPAGSGVSLIDFGRTHSMLRHNNVESIATAIAFPLENNAFLVATASVEESPGRQDMASGDASGSVELHRFEKIDLGGSSYPELVFVLEVGARGGNRRLDVIVCDETGAWCTKPVTLDDVHSGREPWTLPTWNYEAPAYRFRAEVRANVTGLLVSTPGAPDRYFPLDVP
jgi:hypothetical protein